jgi:hypothetical protein
MRFPVRSVEDHGKKRALTNNSFRSTYPKTLFWALVYDKFTTICDHYDRFNAHEWLGMV